MELSKKRYHASEIVFLDELKDISWDDWEMVHDEDEQCMMFEYIGE